MTIRQRRSGLGACLALAAATATGGQASAADQAYGPAVPAEIERPIGLARPAGINAELAEAATRGVETHPAVQAGRAELGASASDIKAAKWRRFPSVSVEAQAFTGGRNAIIRDRNITTNLVVDQPIYAGGRIGGGIRRAKAQEQAAEAGIGEAQRDIALRIVNAYFSLAGGARRGAILDASLAEQRELVDSISRRVTQDVSPKVDLDLAQGRVAQLEQQLALTTSQRYAAVQQLRQLVGDPAYDPGFTPTYDMAVHHPDPAQAVEQAVQCDPTRKRLLAQAQVARADVTIARSSALPSLSAEYSRNEITGDRVGVVLRAQTDGGLANLSTVRSAGFRRDASDLQIDVAERELRETVALDVVENQAARDRIKAGASAVTTASGVTESYKRQFVAGRRTWLDVMNAVREATDAELSEADAENSAMASAARILLRTCRWQPQYGEVAAK